MINFIIGLALGVFVGLYLGNAKFREKVGLMLTKMVASQSKSKRKKRNKTR